MRKAERAYYTNELETNKDNASRTLNKEIIRQSAQSNSNIILITTMMRL